MSDKRIFITGCSGFVGAVLLPTLPTGRLCLFGRKKLLDTDALFVEGEIQQNTRYLGVLDNTDVVIHLAARVHVMQDAATDPLSEFRAVNTEGTLNLARQAAEAGVKRFIFVSSIKVNGESTKSGIPFRFDDDFVPTDPYGLSKYEAEVGLRKIAKETGMEVVIIRPPLVYGEGVKANFASLMRLVDKGAPLPFRAINVNKRSLVSVYNLVDLIKVCIDHPKAANQTFLVSDDDDLSTASMVALMAKVQGKTNLSLPVPMLCFKVAGKLLGKSDVVDRLVGSLQLDIEHTKSTLGWKPPYSVEHGFKLAAKKSV